MSKIPFFNLVSQFLYTNRVYHLSTFLISTLLIFLLSSTLFLGSSIKNSILNSLKYKEDFIIQKIRSGNRVDIESDRIEKIRTIKGISSIKGRVYGRYLIKDDNRYINILGVDLLSDLNPDIEELFQDIDLKSFLSKESMIISSDLSKYLRSRYFTKNYNFFTIDGNIKSIDIIKVIDNNTTLQATALSVMNEDLAREILGIDSDKFSDIVLRVKNDKEKDTILEKLQTLFFDTLIIDKRDILSSYERFFEYKSSFFLLLFTLLLFTYMLILYQRYTLANSSQRRDVAILRMLGWSVNSVIKLKLLESIYIAITAFIVGVILAYIYIEFFHAPLLRDIFFGFGNLESDIVVGATIDWGILITIFLLFIISFVASLIIPIWKIAISDPTEAIK